MFRQIRRTTGMLILAAGLMTGIALARDSKDDGVVGAIFYSGVETAQGALDPLSGLRYGNTFVMNSTGEWDSRYLTVSIHYHDIYKVIRVTGGAWSLTVFRQGSYVGTVYGDIYAGNIQYILGDADKTVFKQTRIKLQWTGGTGFFEGGKNGNINGELTLTTNTRSLQTTGLGIFNF